LYPHFISGRPLLEQAYNMASEAHGAMVRKGDGSPYLNHPVRVAAALWRCQLDEAVVAAGFLHDIVEDTPTPLSLTYKSVSVRM
jgi:GTP pyrophosphokinase